MEDILKVIFRLISIATECGNIAIRLKDKMDYPLYSYSGYGDDFIAAKNSIVDSGSEEFALRECLCGQVIMGYNDTVRAYFTKAGSYWQNRISDERLKELKKNLDDIRKNSCPEIFNSLALVPLKNEDHNVGLFHVSDEKADMLDEATVIKLEALADDTYELIQSIVKNKTSSKNDIKVLVAEDDEAICRVLSRRLESSSIDFHVEHNGLEAFKYLSRNRVDLLVTDVQMPGLSGFQLIRKVRAEFGIYGPKIMIFSSRAYEIDDKFIETNRINRVLYKDSANIRNISATIKEVASG